jgi:hypothetical protein
VGRALSPAGCGALKRRIESSIGVLAGTGTMLPIGGRWRSNASPNDLGEAAGRKRMTSMTHSGTRTEISDCCVFWLFLADPVYNRQFRAKPDGPDTEMRRIASNSMSGSEVNTDSPAGAEKKDEGGRMKDETNRLDGSAGKKVTTVKNGGVPMAVTHDNSDN